MSDLSDISEINKTISSAMHSISNNSSVLNNNDLLLSSDKVILNQYSHLGWLIGVIILVAINIGPFIYYKLKNKSILKSSSENKNGINDTI